MEMLSGRGISVTGSQTHTLIDSQTQCHGPRLTTLINDAADGGLSPAPVGMVQQMALEAGFWLLASGICPLVPSTRRPDELGGKNE